MKTNKEIISKYTIAIKSIEYAAKDLKIEAPETAFLNQNQLPNKDITSIFIPDKYAIVFNESWITDAKIEDVILTCFHETRHAYQHSQIKRYIEVLEVKEKRSVVTQWKNDFDNYRQPTSNKYEKEYVNQSIERDAMRYSMLKIQSLAIITILMSFVDTNGGNGE